MTEREKSTADFQASASRQSSTNRAAMVVVATVMLVVMTAAILSGLFGGPVEHGSAKLRLATGTTLYDAGFWEYLGPIFEERYAVDLQIIYAGTGRALEWGRRGDVDLVVVHSPPCEKEFVAQGYGVKRVPFAYNYFLIVGPPGDPAGIEGLSPQEAFTRLIATGAGRFVSRGDDSGTHVMEQTIWKSAGFDHAEVRTADWYIEAGRGMGPTLLVANGKQAYTLTDMGTFLAFRSRLALIPLVVEGAILLNVYSAIAIDPQRHPGINSDLANKMIDFLTFPEIQARISAMGVEEHGMALFTPCTGTAPCSSADHEQ